MPRPKQTERVALFGNGGGTSVLGTDFFAPYGFEVAPVGSRHSESPTLAEMRRLDLPSRSSVADRSISQAKILRRDSRQAAAMILEAIHASGEADAVVMHINMPVVLGYRDAISAG